MYSHKEASLTLSFEYLGKKFEIPCEGEYKGYGRCEGECKWDFILIHPSITPITTKVECGKNSISFIFQNLPTYASYTIDWEFEDTSRHEGTTWRIFTPYIWACDEDFNCDDEYWRSSGFFRTSKPNNFYFEGQYVKTQCVSSLGQCGIGDYESRIFRWNGKKITIEKEDLSS